MVFLRRIARHCILTCAALLLAFGTKAHAQPWPTLTLMVVPQFPATVLYSTWGKLVVNMDGVHIKMVFAKDIDDFEERFMRGEADLIYCNPYHMVMAKQSQGYLPLLRDAKPLTGILLAPAKGQPGHVSSLEELQGKTMLFPSPNAFGASLYMRALLTEQRGLQFSTQYVKTHPNVIRGVVRSEGAAGGMVAATFLSESEELRSKVQVLYETPPTASHPLAVHPRVPEQLRKHIQAQVLAHLRDDPATAASVQMSHPMLADYKRDYQPLETLGLEKYVSR
ncbi:phosphate/phosphite/phosphonate ABC transporter substrate-binding protein [Limnobacter sp.]|uniref:phosphate/phosphite/phosphonate ABC transporter substrate-binding protein n=1 Tax=Limnobacter sp. TaxID=2003368 RepID=UPI0035135889